MEEPGAGYCPRGHKELDTTSLSLSVFEQRHYLANRSLSSQGYGFSSGHVCMWALDCEENWAPKNWCVNCGVGKDSWESLGLKGYQTSQSLRKSILNIHWKDWCWGWNPNTLATWCEELTHWKRPWSWERLKAGEGDDIGWDGWMASPTWRTRVWENSRRWWRTGKPGKLQSMWLQRVRHDWAIEQQQSDCINYPLQCNKYSQIGQLKTQGIYCLTSLAKIRNLRVA